MKKINILLFSIAFSLIIITGFRFTKKSEADNGISVTGYLNNSDTSIFPRVIEMFLNHNCSSLLDKNKLAAIYSQPDSEILEYYSDNLSDETYPLKCEFKLKTGELINIDVATYPFNSKLPESLFDHYENLKSTQFENLYTTERVGIIDYIFGSNKNNPETCTVVLMHPLNDIDYLRINFSNLSTTCEEFTNIAQRFGESLSKSLFEDLDYIYQTYSGKTTTELLYQYQLESYIEGINFYTNLTN